MKYKKDLPRKYRKYVRWAVYDKGGIRLSIVLETLREAREFTAGWSPRNYSVRPVLCLPLSMIAAPNFNWSIFGVDDEEYAALVKPDFNGPQNGPVDA